MLLIQDICGFCYTVLICLHPKNILSIFGCLFCCAILLNLGMGNGEPDEPLENVFPADAEERAQTWLGILGVGND